MSTVKIHVFYGVQYMASEQDVSQIKHVPDGAYVKMQLTASKRNSWYIKDNGALIPVAIKDIPSQIKAQMLLLGEEL